MVLDERDTAHVIPASFVPPWVADDDISLKITAFLATLIVYDACEHPFYATFSTELTHALKVITLDKEVPKPTTFYSNCT